VTTAFKVSLMW